jgi:hypothetical protein
MENLLNMDTFSSLDWVIDETAMFADNNRTGERILLSRFNQSARLGIVLVNTNGTMVWGTSKWDESKYA